MSTVAFDVITELDARGLVKQNTNPDELAKLLASGPQTLYAGFDPTGPSLHVGHMVPLIALMHFAKAGHRAVALVGGGTARIGDPSGKTEARKMLTGEQVDANAASLATQIKALAASAGVELEVVNNADWLKGLEYISFLRDIGKHFSVNRMLSFETYKMRLETGLSFLEFNYQLLQSYDFLKLHQNQGCRLQIGGDDQWGNIVAGIDLIRREGGAECYGLTFPLLARSDGKKMGKTENGAIFLNADQTPVFDFFQYFRNFPDADVEMMLSKFTFIPVDEIKALMADKAQINQAKERLAMEMTSLVHGNDAAEKALADAKALFAGQGRPADLPQAPLAAADLAAGINAADLFMKSGLCQSKSDARRLFQGGGAKINDTKVENHEMVIDSSWIDQGELLLRAGKKRAFLFTVEG